MTTVDSPPWGYRERTDDLVLSARRAAAWLLDLRNPDAASSSVHGQCPSCRAAVDTPIDIYTTAFACGCCGRQFVL